jgi:hypothetical protein
MKLLSSATVLLTVSAGIPKCTLNPEASVYSSGDGPDEVFLPGQGEIYDFFKFNSATGKIEFKFDFSAYDGECYLQVSFDKLISVYQRIAAALCTSGASVLSKINTNFLK